jgi:hypothetical protein
MLSYSNFQTFTNIKPQFQYINQLTPYDNLDTLNYRQLSQNANMNVNYIINKNKEKPQNLNVNISFLDSYDMQGDAITKGNASQFYNFAGSYNRSNLPKALNLTGAFNLTYNTIGTNELTTLGPILAASKMFGNKKLRTGASLSYNQTLSQSNRQNQVVALWINAGYVYKKKHNISCNTVAMKRSTLGNKSAQDITATLNYNYSF